MDIQNQNSKIIVNFFCIDSVYQIDQSSQLAHEAHVISKPFCKSAHHEEQCMFAWKCTHASEPIFSHAEMSTLPTPNLQ